MLYVDEKTKVIKLTRGDTARFAVGIENELTGKDYELSDGDELIFSIKKTVHDTETLVKKICTGTDIVHIKPEDTSGLAFGKYKYDVQITTSDGDVYTIIEPTTFELLSEVTY